MSQVEHQIWEEMVVYIYIILIILYFYSTSDGIFKKSISYLEVTLGVSWFPRLKLGHADIDWQHFKYFDKFSATFKKKKKITISNLKMKST